MSYGLCSSLWFASAKHIEVRKTDIPVPGSTELLVKSICSAISAGTELLAFNGLLPSGIPLDTSLKGMRYKVEYPMKYGYSSVGFVKSIGNMVDPHWLGRRVYAFHPHESHFIANTNDLIPLPENIDNEDALFLANMETAVNLLLDGAPMIGEKVLVLGLGVVGQLLASLLAEYPLSKLVVVDPTVKRRLAAQKDNNTTVDCLYVMEKLGVDDIGHYDLVYETSGSPGALDDAVKRTGYHGRLIVGSWYGQKQVCVDLGTYFHRSKMSIYASQVSKIDPSLTGRWDNQRRIRVALDMLMRTNPRQLITHRYSIDNAEKAYRLLAERKEEAIQVILTY